MFWLSLESGPLQCLILERVYTNVNMREYSKCLYNLEKTVFHIIEYVYKQNKKSKVRTEYTCSKHP